MPTMIQLRNVPDDIHRKLKVRAAEAGVPLSDYLLGELRYLAELPTQDELMRRLAAQPPTDVSTNEIVEAVRHDRDAH